MRAWKVWALGTAVVLYGCAAQQRGKTAGSPETIPPCTLQSSTKSTDPAQRASLSPQSNSSWPRPADLSDVTHPNAWSPALSCDRTPTPDLKAQLRERIETATACYESALWYSADVPEEVVVALRIAQNGAVIESEVTEDGEAGPLFDSCLLSIFEKPYRQLEDRQCTELEIPLTFAMVSNQG